MQSATSSTIAMIARRRGIVLLTNNNYCAASHALSFTKQSRVYSSNNDVDEKQKIEAMINNPVSKKLIAAIQKQKQEFIVKLKQRAPVTDEQLLQSVPWYFRPFVKDKINDLREVADQFSEINQQQQQILPTTLEPKSKYAKSELASSVKREKSLLLRMGGVYSQEGQLRKSSDLIWNHILEHVRKFDAANIYRETHLPTPKESWTHSEFYMIVIHMWVVLRRLRFEGSDGEVLARMLVDNFFNFVEQKIVDVGVSQFALSKYGKQLQESFYGLMVSFDRALTLPQDQDALLAECVWRNIYAGEEIHIDALYFWVRYLRFSLSLLDHIDSYQLLKGIFQFYVPNSEFEKSFSTMKV